MEDNTKNDLIQVPEMNITVRINPFKSDEELAERVRENLDWYDLSDKPPTFSLVHLVSGFGSERDFYPEHELYSVILGLPNHHRLNQEVIRQSKKNLTEITTKSAEELRHHVPRYLNAFLIGDIAHPEEMFEEIKRAAYHLMNNPVLTQETPPEEANIMFSAARGMSGYSKTKPEEVLRFLSLTKSRKLVLPYTLTGSIELGVTDIVPFYFHLINHADCQEDFVLDSIQRQVGFKFIGRRLKREFPDYDYQTEIDNSKPELRERIREILNLS